MYRIFGSDGKEYGPISADQLRQWIREGRAGGATQVRLESDAHWVTLHSVSEFADVFQSPPTFSTGGAGALPPVVRTFGVLSLVLGVAGLLYQSFSWMILIRTMQQAPSLSSLPASYYFFNFIGFTGVVIHIVGGIGLLRGREWARRLTVYWAAISILLGLWSLGRTLFWLTTTSSSLHLLASPQFLFSIVLSVAQLAFHLAAIVLLSRREVRAALAQKVSGPV